VIRGTGHPVAVAGDAHEGIVDSPRVDADAEQAGLGPDGLAQSFEDVAVELKGVPVQAVGGAHRLVGEPVHDLDVEPVRSDPAEDDAAAGGAEVDGRDGTAGRGPGVVVVHRRKAAATPASTGMCSPVVWERSAEQSAKTALATCSGRTSRLSKVRLA